MRTISFLLAIIAIACGGVWYWLTLQDSSPSAQATSPTFQAPTEQGIAAPTLENSVETVEETEADWTDNLEASSNGNMESSPIPLPQPRFSAQNVGDDRITAERNVASIAPSELENFKSRPIAYNRPPEILALGKSVDVSLIIDATSAAAPTTGLEGFEGEIVERDVVLSDEVAAQLTGAAFDIELMSVSRQILSSRAQNRWQWRVTPREVGDHMLIMEIFGYAQGSSAAEPLDAYRDRISVEVKQFDQIVTLAQNYEPVIGAIGGIAGIFSAFFAFIRFTGNRKGKKKRA